MINHGAPLPARAHTHLNFAKIHILRSDCDKRKLFWPFRVGPITSAFPVSEALHDRKNACVALDEGVCSSSHRIAEGLLTGNNKERKGVCIKKIWRRWWDTSSLLQGSRQHRLRDSWNLPRREIQVRVASREVTKFVVIGESYRTAKLFGASCRACKFLPSGGVLVLSEHIHLIQHYKIREICMSNNRRFLLREIKPLPTSISCSDIS